MTEADDNVKRLRAALTGSHDDLDHEACLEMLPDFVEAEMADEDAAHLFPAVQAHLDLCPDCEEVHAAMVDLLLAEEAGLIPEVDSLPPLRLPRRLLQRRWAREIAEATLASLQGLSGNLQGAARAFFDALDKVSDQKLEPHSPSLAFAMGPSDSDSLSVLMAAYYALSDLAQTHSAEALQALNDSGRLQPLIEKAANDEVRRLGLRGQAATQFVATFSQMLRENLARLLALTYVPDDISGPTPSQ